MILDDLYLEYGEKATKSLTLDDIECLRKELPKVELSELRNQNDYSLYIELVKKFREYGVMGSNASQGEGFQAWLTNTLIVGEDGIYADGESKFLFELIQNVDDCDYDDTSNCNLEIEFCPQQDTITLFYNENGFYPKDVFNITGIAERSKNISANKIEIGEKGIGFKSVFGIAEEVLIQSGNFSFALKRGNFTVPELRNEGFTGIKGTKLTLFIKKHEDKRISKVQTIYENLVERYKDEESLINKNPILFLNKLTKLKMFIDGFRNISFSVFSVKPQKLENGIEFEKDVTINAVFKNPNYSAKEYNKSIKCYRYTSDVVFDRTACISRYGEATLFQEKKMRFNLLFPHADELNKIKQGSLYSFLPTQTKATVPIIIHAPFKLAASRDYIDSQNGNRWFSETVAGLNSLIIGSYNHLALYVKNDIIKYLSHSEEYFFDGNDKVSCLRISEFSRTCLLNERLFICADGNFYKAAEVCAFSSDDTIKDILEAQCLAKIETPLFVVDKTIGLGVFGIKIIKGIKDAIFFRALEDGDISKNAFDFLMAEEYKPDEDMLKQKIKNIKFTIQALKILSYFEDYKKAISDALIVVAKASFDDLPIVTPLNSVTALDSKHRQLVEDALGEIERQIKLKDYWDKIKGTCFCCETSVEEFYFPTPSFLLLFGESPLKALESFARSLGGSRLFEVALTSCDVSEQLDKLCDDFTIDGDDFFDRLREQRGFLRRSFGKEAYGAYIKIIQDAGADKSRFLKELIQNADDCEYLGGAKPQFRISIDGQKITTESNERGFTRNNLRAITAIGESTKKRLFGNNMDSIGEKGIGFKSIFGIANIVTIRSRREKNHFDFSLSCDTPTIPKSESSKGFDNLTGTRMNFVLKQDITLEMFSEEKIIEICRCLRKLRQIEIRNLKIDINDTDDVHERLITLKDGHLSVKQIKMSIVRHDFEVIDEQAVADRIDGRSLEIKKSQTVFVYIPENNTITKGSVCPIYAGLPTSDTINAPLYIDAPFDLTASRERIKKNKWNEIIIAEVLISVAKALAEIASRERINVLNYIPEDCDLFNGEFAQDAGADFDWALGQCKLLPTLEKEYFAAPFGDLVYYPYFIKLLLDKSISISEIDLQKTIDFFKTDRTEKYLDLLKHLGCKQADDNNVLDIIANYAQPHLFDKDIRLSVYSYFKNIQQQTRQEILHKIKQLKIVPVKAVGEGKPVFVSFSEKPIWYGDSEKSTDSYYILFTDWLAQDDFNRLFDLTSNANTNIKEMNNAQRRAEYENKLNQFFNRCDVEEKYEWLINEYKTNRQELLQSQGWFLQNRDRIPLLRADEDYAYANSSIFKAAAGIYKVIQGEQLKSFLISIENLSLADFLQLPCITKISFSEYNTFDEVLLTREDILDLQNSAIIPYYNGIAILAQCKDAGYISDTLIEEMNLGGLGDSEIDENEYEFPQKPISNNLNAYIAKILKSPTKIINKQVERNERWCSPAEGREYELSTSSDDYPKHMYSPDASKKICFCQWCKKPFDIKYIEINKIEYKSDKYYWDQLKLSFCLKHSKDFKELRNNPLYGNSFIEAIIENDIATDSDGTVSVRIGDKQISFTATHFAEVQQILIALKKEIRK